MGVPLALAGLAASGVVAFATPGSDAQTAVPAPSTQAPDVTSTVRDQAVSRGGERSADPTPSAPTEAPSPQLREAEALTPARATKPSADDLAARPKVSGTMYATDALNIRTDPAKGSDVVTVVEAGTKLSVTSTVRKGFRLVSYRGKGRWVSADHVSTSKPKPEPVETSGVSEAACSSGSAMESGLTPDAVLVHRTLCARFPGIGSFGGRRSGSDFHGTGQAVDCMIADSGLGWQVARWVRAHARELGVSEVIYAQKIWTVQRGGEGWRAMSDRGSATANHYDHVHVSVYGNRATG